MKTKNLAGIIFGMVFVFLALAFISANLGKTNLYYEDDPSASSKTINSGDKFNVFMTASSYGETLLLEKLELVQGSQTSLIKNWNDPGKEIGQWSYLFSDTYTIDSKALSLASGTYKLRFTAKTSVTGEVQYSELNLIINVQNTAPIVNILTPLNGNTYTSLQNTITYTATDAQNNLQDCQVFDGTTTTPWAPCTGTLTGLNSQQGSNTWIVYARDSMGLIGQATVTFNININTAPAVQITYPTNTNYPTLITTANFNVNTGGENDLASCSYKLNNGPVTPVSCSEGANTITGLNTIQGSNTLIVYARDTAGNVGQDTVTFSIIPNAPTINIIYPVNGNAYTTPVTNISFIPTDAQNDLDVCWYSLDGGITQSIPVSCTNGATNIFSGLTSQTGSNTWIVYAQDLAGNVGTATVTFTYNIPSDTTPPVITIIFPQNGDELTDLDAILKVSLNEDGAVNYSINSEPNVTMTKQGATFNFWSNSLKFSDHKTYTVTYYATDLAGNTASKTIIFTTDEEEDDGNGDSDGSDSYWHTKYIDQYKNKNPLIDLSDDESKHLSGWQKFVSWFLENWLLLLAIFVAIILILILIIQLNK